MYWSDRKKRLDASMAKDESRLYAKRAAYYEREAARLDKEIAAYYSKYSVNGVLSYRNLLETLPDGDKQLLIQNMDEFVKKYPEYADLVPVRESIYKLNRLEGLRQSIAMQQLEMGASDIAAAREFFRRQSLRYANGAAQHLGLGSSFYTIDSDMVNRFVGNDWCDGKDFSARIWANRDKLARTLHTDVLNGVIRGDSYQRISDAVQKRFTEVSRKDIERLVFTEDTYLSNEAAIGVFEADGVTEAYTYVCAPTGACPICQELNGQQFQIKDREPGVNFPPMHPWCRCFFDPVVKSLDDFIAAEKKNALTFGGDSGIIEEKNPLKINLQFFGNRNIPKMKSFLLLKSIKSWKREIEEHKDKISNPEKHYPLWNTFDARLQNGYKKHWEKEIATMQSDIEQAINELKKRGDYDE